MDKVSSLSLYEKAGTNQKAIEYLTEHNNTYVSLFWLFKLPQGEIRHSILLKNNITENNIFLLSTRVECEIEISNDQIYPIPAIFSDKQFSVFFSGIRFGSDFLKTSVEDTSKLPGSYRRECPILVINSEKIMKYIQNRKVLNND
jgi:hypothetical protein